MNKVLPQPMTPEEIQDLVRRAKEREAKVLHSNHIAAMTKERERRIKSGQIIAEGRQRYNYLQALTEWAKKYNR